MYSSGADLTRYCGDKSLVLETMTKFLVSQAYPDLLTANGYNWSRFLCSEPQDRH
jgi:hypothetical protein